MGACHLLPYLSGLAHAIPSALNALPTHPAGPAPSQLKRACGGAGQPGDVSGVLKAADPQSFPSELPLLFILPTICFPNLS